MAPNFGGHPFPPVHPTWSRLSAFVSWMSSCPGGTTASWPAASGPSPPCQGISWRLEISKPEPRNGRL